MTLILLVIFSIISYKFVKIYIHDILSNRNDYLEMVWLNMFVEIVYNGIYKAVLWSGHVRSDIVVIHISWCSALNGTAALLQLISR